MFLDWLKPRLIWFFLAALTLLLDAVSKHYALNTLGLREVQLLPFLKLSLALNRGAAFSFLSHTPYANLLFLGLAAVFSVGVVLSLKPEKRLESLGLSLMLGGALGNFLDRLLRGFVVDFIDVFYGGRHFPTFNLADSALNVGLGFLLISVFLLSRRGGGKA